MTTCKHGVAISLRPSINFVRCAKCDEETDRQRVAMKPLSTREQELNDAQPLTAYEIAHLREKYTLSAFPFDKIDDARLLATITALRAALEWYEPRVAGCRKITFEGDAARRELDADGGQRARASLAKG